MKPRPYVVPILVFCTVLVAAVIGCGGGSVGPGTTGSNGTTGSLPLRSGVVQINPSNLVSISPDQSVIELGPTAPSVSVGSVLFMHDEGGMIRKVSDVQTTRAGQILLTNQGTLEEALAPGEISVVRDLEYNDWKFDPSSLPMGVTVEPSSSGRALSVPVFHFDNVELAPGVTASGSIQLDMGLDAHIEMGFLSIKEFHFIPDITLSGQLEIKAGVNINLDKDIVLIPELRSEIDLGPVPALAKFKLVAHAQASFHAGFGVKATASARLRAGVVYSNGQWDTVRDLTPTFTLTPSLEPTARVDFAVIPLRPTVTVLIANVAGPQISADLPRLDGYAEMSGNQVHLRSDWTVDASADIIATIFGHTILDKAFPHFFVRSGPLVDQLFTLGGGSTGTSSGTTGSQTTGSNGTTSSTTGTGSSGGGVNASVYVQDLNVPDGTSFAPNQGFNKAWRIRNSGNTTWGPGYHWVYVSGDQMGAPSSIDVPSVSPGSTWDPSVNFVAPNSNGTYRSYWQMESPSGIRFGTQVWVLINVTSPPPPGFHYNVWRGGSDAFNRSGAWAAQSFVAQYNTVHSVTFNPGQTDGGYANSVTVFIYSNEAMTNQIGAKFVNSLNAYGETTITFDNPIQLNPGQTYWVQLHTGEANKRLQLYASNHNDYGSGCAYWHDYNANTIKDLNSDLNLRIQE